jgi:hypothetical protein
METHVHDTTDGELQKLFPSIKLDEVQQALCLTWWRRLKEKQVFALIETLGDELEREGLTFEEYSSLLPLYTRVQEWLLEDSDFLTTYPQEHREEIRGETEKRLRDAYARGAALRLISEGKELDYISTLLHKLDASGYLYDREQRFITLFVLFRWSPKLVMMPAREFIRLLYLSEQNLIPISFNAMLEQRLSLLETRNFPYARRTPENLAGMEEAMRLIAARLLTSKNVLPDVCARAAFFRLVYMLSESRPEIILTNAINTLLFRNAGAKFTLNDLIHLEIPEFTNKVLSYTSISSTMDMKTRLFRGKGRLMLKEGTIYLLSEHVVSPVKEHEIPNMAALPLRVVTSKDDDFTQTDASALSNAWKRVFQEFARSKKKTVVTRERPSVGVKVKIQVKNLHPTMTLLAFVRIVDDHFEGEGILHVRQITRIKLTSLEHILEPGNKMTATVIEATPEKLSFSIIDELDAIVGTRLQPGELTNALLLAKRSNLLTWLSEDGYSLYTLPNPNMEVEVGDYYLLELVNVNSNGYVKAVVKEPVEAEFDVHEAVSNLLYSYIDEPEELPREEEEEKISAPVEQANPLSPAYMSEMIQALGLYVSPRLSPRNLNLLYALKLMAYIANDPVAEEFYAGQIAYMLAINEFVSGKAGSGMELFPDPAGTEGFVERFPVLESWMTVSRVLTTWNNEAGFDRLLALSRGEDPLIARLSTLVISHNLLQPVAPDLSASVKEEIIASLAELPDEPEEEVVLNVYFGTENHHREFKTSAIFPPESTGVADVERQLDVILRTITGFLNAEGGTLYIGVNDFGLPSGIQADLFHLHGDEDKYQLLIRQRVVENLGMDVNGLLVFKFMTYGQKIVCAVAVPSYHQAVAYKNIVWQRQGNATRPVQKSDLKLLKMRKKEAGISHRASVPLFPGDPGYEMKAVAAVPVAPPAPPAEEKPKIATSLLRDHKGEELACHFSFLKQGRYTLSETLSRRDDCLLSLAIPGGEEYFLVQVYDTGHVNCVAAAALLGKKRGFDYQNGSFANAGLIFAAFACREDFFFFKILVNREEHIKVVPVQHVKVNADLSLKGTAVITAKFDRIVQVDILTPRQAGPLTCKEDSSPLGMAVRSLSVVKDVIYLDELFKTGKTRV